MRLQLTNDSPQSSSTTNRQSSDRQSLSVLYRIATSRHLSPDINAARAGLGARIVLAMAVPLLPFLALGLSVPPKRHSTAIGIGFGMAILVVFVQMAHALEEQASTASLFQFALLWALLAMISISAAHYHHTNGPGHVEAHLSRLVRPALSVIGRVLKFFV